MKHILELNEFFVEGKNRSQSHVLLHITEPNTPEERKKGYFFAVAEIEHGDVEQIEHIQKMIDDLESGYYETDDEEEKGAFELTLEYINRRGHHLLSFQNSYVNAIVGVVQQGKISFAYHGEPTALVYYQGKQGYQTLPVIDPSEQPADDQLFSALMEGEIQVGDYFFVTTPHVSEYLSDDRLEKIITSRPTEQSASHLQKVLTNLRSEESFGGIIFHLVTKDQLPKTGKMPAHLKQGSADSLDKLISGQQETEETLYPPMLNKAASAISRYVKKEKQEPTQKKTKSKLRTRIKATSKPSGETNFRERIPSEPKESFLNTLLIEFGKVLVIAAKFLGVVLQRTLLMLRDGLVILVVLITNKGGQRQVILNKIREYVTRKQTSFGSMPMTSKVLLVATITFATIFIGSIIFLRIKEAADARVAEYNTLVQGIVDKTDAAEASLIYGDDEKAFTLLKEAEELIAQLPTRRDPEVEQAETLATNVEEALMKLRKIETVTPTVLTNISSTFPGAQVADLELLDDTLVVFGPNDSNHYLVDADTGSIEQREHGALPSLLAASTPKENDFSLFITQNGLLGQLDDDGNLASKNISFINDSPAISDLFVYNRRVYSLDQAGEQIFRHNPIASGYDRGSAWIESKQSSLTDAVSLAIDGDIFVLTSRGQIVKFQAGEEVDFSLRGLDPALTQPTEIWTYNDTQNIYILEPENKRIVIANKDGQLIRQLTAKEWQFPTSMVINEDAGVAYVLDSGVVYRVNL